ncbi:hypothetical protein PIB30_010182 [Stylosanthes scabra]|uniref:Uncharacterized protein n=1 Tax=Stylosanthes scabra TaxID=79078 RepID=A0ABU6R5T5_9FABA|nr:hypothetical protein [Stylosanthes scabra]
MEELKIDTEWCRFKFGKFVKFSCRVQGSSFSKDRVLRCVIWRTRNVSCVIKMKLLFSVEPKLRRFYCIIVEPFE